jgi:hypothetical protein
LFARDESARLLIRMGWAKIVVAAAVALLLGIFIGGLGPRAELARAKDALAEAEARAQHAGNSSLPLALGMRSLLEARAQAGEGPRNERTGVPRFVPSPGDDEAPEPVPGPAAERDPEQAIGGDGGVQERRAKAETFRAAKAAADLRAAQFRIAFLEEAKLPAASVTALDASIKTMNDELGRAAEEIVKDLTKRRETNDRLLPRDVADIGARVLDIYRRADDQFKSALDDNGRAAVRKSNFDLLTQIDIGAFEHLAESIETFEPPRFAPLP